MSIVVPPAPSHKAAPAVMKKLSQASGKDLLDGSKQAANRQPQMLLAASCVFSLVAILLFACAIVVMCAPESLPGRLVILVCKTLL